MRFLFKWCLIAAIIYGSYWLWQNKETKLSSLLSYYLNCDVSISHIEIKNWNSLVLQDITLTSATEPAFQATSVSLKFHWKDCLTRPFPIQEMTICQPQLYVQLLDRSSQHSNWSMLLSGRIPSSMPITIKKVYIDSSQIYVQRPSRKEICFTMKAMTLECLGGQQGLNIGQTTRTIFYSMLSNLTHQPPLHHLLDSLPLPQKPQTTPHKATQTPPSTYPQQLQHVRKHVHSMFS
ncbi:MAG: hypothetical protein JSS62_01415 [Verrucomicrobia bacterium]|nr:hypothetical protein [Verrucomicrobiota bacterium]MBS0645829.1 hypothetical protein [Verrucomicrobiota bacterium]